MVRGFFAAVLLATAAQAAEPLRVGLAGAEPMVSPGPPASGVAVDVWEKIAAANTWSFEYKTFSGVDAGIAAVGAGEIDVLVGDIAIEKSRLSQAEFSQPFFRSGFQIMISEARPHSVSRLGTDLLDLALTKVFWWAVALVAGFSFLVYFFERRHNPDFPKSRSEGLVEALYYVVTLALSGKSAYKGFPGILGRLVMVAWIILGIITVAYVTSSITSSMTLEKLGNRIAGPQDLPGKTVGVVEGSAAADYLRAKGITILPAPDLAGAVHDLLGHRSAAVVDAAPVLQSYDFNNPRLPITEVGPVFAPQNYGIALAVGSPLRLPLNAALLDLEESGALRDIFRRYFGDEVFH